MLYTWNQHSTANQVYFNKNKIKDISFELKKKKNSTCQIFPGHKTKIKLDYLNHDLSFHAAHLFSFYKDTGHIGLRFHLLINLTNYI